MSGRRVSARIGLIFSLFMFVSASASAGKIQSPEEYFGFPMGADFRLVRWEKIVEYFRLVANGSDRVLVEEIGRTTEGNAYIMATISSASTIAEIGRYKKIQRKISHPNEIAAHERDRLLAQSKTVILVTCSLHSTEIGASQMSLELLYELATGEDERTNEILENDIILLVPSANPDGINKVIDWYESSLNKPWEGQGMPWLYQKYAGHDDNRDWFMLTQKETRILTRVLYHEWYPCIVYDLHQMGNTGCRFFVPPFFDPVNPNVDPLIHESLKIIGGHMATDLAAQGKKGVISNAIYDNWWHGGNRTTPYRHNMIGILTEAASPRIASPIFQRKSELKGHSRGLPKYAPQVNFADPWEGGWWRLRDVVEYEKIACYSLFTVAARYRDMFNGNYLALNEKAIRLGREVPPFAFLIPLDPCDLPTAVRLLEILQLGGVDISVADEPFVADDVPYPEGTYVIFASQPYRNHVKDLLEPQDYPDRYVYPGGPAEPPYDVAGWTLSYQMGVNVIRVRRPFEARTHIVDWLQIPEAAQTGSGPLLLSRNQTTHDFILLNRAFRERIPAFIMTRNWNYEGEEIPRGSLVFSPQAPFQNDLLDEWIGQLGLRIQRIPVPPGETRLVELRRPRLGLYQPWAPSMDEGWTRFVLEQFEFNYRTIHNAEIRAGNLHGRYDAIILPDVGTKTLLEGMKEATTAPRYVGGIGTGGVARLQEFVEEGGRLLCLDSSSLFAIRHFKLPLRNVLSGLKRDKFFCPGSILRISLDTSSPVAYGMPNRAGAYFSNSYAFDIVRDATDQNFATQPAGRPEVIATYDNAVLLLSGWILGEKYLQGKPAIVSVPYGKGRIILYGLRVQHRGQPHGTFRLLFNGILLGGLEKNS